MLLFIGGSNTWNYDRSSQYAPHRRRNYPSKFWRNAAHVFMCCSSFFISLVVRMTFHFIHLTKNRIILVQSFTIRTVFLAGPVWQMHGIRLRNWARILWKYVEGIRRAYICWVGSNNWYVYCVSLHSILILGYSQGGLLSRAMLENLPDHNVKHFISLSSPQAGQYGSEFWFYGVWYSVQFNL